MDNIEHIALSVSDIKEALGWYRSHFDVRTLYEDETWAMMRFSNIDVALVVPGQHPPHIAVKRRNAESFGKLQQHRDGTASVYINDPFDNVIEVIDAI